MSGIRRFSAAITSPWAWADHRKLRVERRDEGRAGQPRAYVFADEHGQVIPTVYFFRNRVHNSEPIRHNSFKRMEYEDLDELVGAGWRPHSSEELDIPLGS